MTSVEHYHVIDDWCGMTGGTDYGFVPTHGEAEAAIEAQREAGHKGGCRHAESGWDVRGCFKDDCLPYDKDRELCGFETPEDLEQDPVTTLAQDPVHRSYPWLGAARMAFLEGGLWSAVCGGLILLAVDRLDSVYGWVVIAGLAFLSGVFAAGEEKARHDD